MYARLFTLLALASLTASAPDVASANELRVVALTDTLVGVRTGREVSFLDTPQLNEAGRVAMRVYLDTPGDREDSGIWSERIGRARPVVQHGDLLPGGVLLEDINPGAWNFTITGHIAFSTDGSGIWSDRSGALQTLVSRGTPAPGAGRNYGSVGLGRMRDDGKILFTEFGDQASIVWTDRDGPMRQFVTLDLPIPGIPEATEYRSLDLQVSADLGVAYFASVELSNPPPRTTFAMLTEDDGVLKLAMRNGGLAPTEAGDQTFALIQSGLINNSLQFAFRALLTDTDGNPNNDWGAWLFDGHELQFLTRHGATSPAGGPDATFNTVNEVLINDNSNVVMSINFQSPSGPNGRGLFYWSDGKPLRTIVSTGHAAPEAGPNVTFATVLIGAHNANDQVLVEGWLTGDGVNETNDIGLWAVDPRGRLRMIVREGDSIQVAPNEFRIVSEIRAGYDSFNDRGQVAFTAEFTDGTWGTFVSDRASIVRTLVPDGAAWRYLDNGSNQNIAWRAKDFNDAAWPVGRGEFGYGDADESTVVRCGPTPACNANNFITTYFRTEFTVDDPADFAAFTMELLRDDAAAVYINGVEAFRDAGLAPNAAFNALANFNGVPGVAGLDEATFRVIPLASALFHSGRNVIAVEVHQFAATSSDVSFDLRLTGELRAVAVPEPSSISTCIVAATLMLALAGRRDRAS